MNPQQISMTTDPTSTSQSSSSGQSDDSKVTSRLAMSDEQRKIRDNFEEKQREEARKKAKLEKAEQKKVRKEKEYEFETMRKRYISIIVTNLLSTFSSHLLHARNK